MDGYHNPSASSRLGRTNKSVKKKRKLIRESDSDSDESDDTTPSLYSGSNITKVYIVKHHRMNITLALGEQCAKSISNTTDSDLDMMKDRFEIGEDDAGEIGRGLVVG